MKIVVSAELSKINEMLNIYILATIIIACFVLPFSILLYKKWQYKFKQLLKV